MVIRCVVNGGVGNQLFQLAAAHHVSNITGAEIQIDVSELVGRIEGHLPGTPRDLQIHRLFPHLEVVSKDPESLRATNLEPKNDQPRFWHSHRNKLIEDRYDLSQKSDLRMTGNWQAWQEYATTLPQFVTLTRKALDKLTANLGWLVDSNQSGVAIHMRFGDYLGSSKYRTLTPAHYKKALAMLGSPREKLLVCTDDRIRAQEVLHQITEGNEQVIISSHQDPLHDLNLLRMTRLGFIGSNSTFSWWAAMLANANVVIPKHWFKSRTGRSSKHYHVPNWHTI